jgi:hypothetical protein
MALALSPPPFSASSGKKLFALLLFLLFVLFCSDGAEGKCLVPSLGLEVVVALDHRHYQILDTVTLHLAMAPDVLDSVIATLIPAKAKKQKKGK